MKFLIANWKMNTDYKEAGELADFYRYHLKSSRNVHLIVCPPAIWLENLAKKFKNYPIDLGAQNIHWLEKGAITGEISAPMVKEFCRYAIIGHSERRKFFSESDEVINQKIKTAIKNNLTPILCVGEDKQAEGEGHMLSQVSRGVAGLSSHDLKNMVIAYEPIWAISANKDSEVATTSYVTEMINSIRDRLAVIYGREISNKIRIVYGGSVHSKNIKSFLDEKTINGFLVGSASLDCKVFEKIYNSLV